MRIASSSWPAADSSPSVGVAHARSSSTASRSCSHTRAAPLPFHHVISALPRRSSSQVATFSIAGCACRVTGSTPPLALRIGPPSGTRSHRRR
ncbi:hypothetical protein WK30_04585 [Burkholderia vietnamiensis]|nr:hypothetical protein WJ57_23910 [Burkholderia vietnamiensis]KVS06631.1 hypothetical protein WK30_04585 [Burkholderia vietnamiensis]